MLSLQRLQPGARPGAAGLGLGLSLGSSLCLGMGEAQPGTQPGAEPAAHLGALPGPSLEASLGLSQGLNLGLNLGTWDSTLGDLGLNTGGPGTQRRWQILIFRKLAQMWPISIRTTMAGLPLKAVHGCGAVRCGAA